MANIVEYLDWRGDLPFAVSPFNEVDNYIVCKLGCPDYSGIVPEEGILPLAAAVERCFAGEPTLGVLASPFILPVLRRLPETVRFGGLFVGDYAKISVPERSEQFSALTVWLPDGSRYVSFRGTDDTLAAWKEDFLMGVEDQVPAQRDAAAYLQKEAERAPGPLRVGGHSKGGNLAVYAAMTAPEAVQERILDVYNNDGPGFRRDVSDEPGYRRIRPKLHTLVSQHAVIGLLLHHDEDCCIVRSDEPGAAAHDGFHWQVRGTAFERCEDFALASKAFQAAMTELEERLSPEELRAFVDALFEVLSSTGAVTLSDLTEHRLRQGLSIANELRQTPEVTRCLGLLLGQTLRAAVGETRRRGGRRFLHRDEREDEE